MFESWSIHLLTQSVIEQVCRLSRIIASPHEGANTVLVAEGCPVRCSTITRLAATLCGFHVYQISSQPPNTTAEARMEAFKSDLVSGYTRAGARVRIAIYTYKTWILSVCLSVCLFRVFRSHQKSQSHEILALGLIWANLKHDEDRSFKFFI